MPPKTTIKWLFNDKWCYFIACFDCKIVVFQQTVVRFYYILSFGLPQSLSHGQYCSILPYFAFQHWCVLPLVILGFPWLILVYFSVSCCYQLFLSLLGQLQFISPLSLSNLCFTWLNSVDVSFSCENLCNPRFNSVYFSVNLSVIFTRLMIGLCSLKSG